MKIARVLSFDSGFMQGLLGANFMNQFCQDAGIAVTDIYKYFDIITGVGGNALQALFYAYGMTPDEVITFYKTNGPNIFTPLLTSNQKIAANITETAFYTTNVLKTKLVEQFGTDQMFQLKTNVIIPTVQFTDTSDTTGINLETSYVPTLFSNMIAPDLTGQSYLISDVAMAASAIPSYFPAYGIIDPNDTDTTLYYRSGELYTGNPATIAFASESILEGSTYDRLCVLSVGSGKGTIGFYEPTSIPPAAQGDSYISLPTINNVYYSTAMQANADSVDKTLEWLSLSGGRLDDSDLFYYRFQTTFDATNTELDNSSDTFIKYMASAASNQYTIDKFKIAYFLQNAQLTN